MKKTIYGLKQSGREWNIKLDSVLKNIGFKQCNSDPCVYTKNYKNYINIIAIYVDDILLACSSLEVMSGLKDKICKQFKVVD